MANKKKEALPIPEYQVMAYARLILPEIRKFYESEEGQREFAQWQAQQAQQEKVAV